jgi:Tfp pilus assembly protein PilX
MLLKDIKNNKQGFALLVISMMVLTFILIVALGASAIVRNGIIMGRGQMESTKAFFAAEAGAERVLWEIWQNNIISTYPCPTDDGSDYDKFCFTVLSSGDVNECIVIGDDCTPVENQQQKLSNQALYSIKYEHNDTTGRATSTIIGNYADINSRVIKLIY